MYTHNLDPVLIDFGFIVIRWYSLAYIFGIIIGWWLGKRIIIHICKTTNFKFNLSDFDDLITYLIIAIIIGGRLGYVIFYNLEYFLSNPFEIIKVWEGGMSFHGALIGIILGTYFFCKSRNISTLFSLDVIACVSPIGIFLGRIANFINGELVGKVTNSDWGVFFPNYDDKLRHPSQLYEAFLEGIILFILMNLIFFNKNYKIGTCSFMFLILYGCFRITSEIFREPDIQIGYLFGYVSMGMFLSAIMILIGFLIYFKRNDEIKSQKI